MKTEDVTLLILAKLKRYDRNPLTPMVVKNFIEWAKGDGGCWWWIRSGARECIRKGLNLGSGRYGNVSRIKKEDLFITEFPFTHYVDLPNPKSHYAIFQDLLIDEWLKFINERKDIKDIILENYDIVTEPIL